ncbi:MAG: hypothetical protein GC159_10075 [Phycisphaera sp.]|nr:hypothetical protein [Phycisphaera sp.]
MDTTEFNTGRMARRTALLGVLGVLAVLPALGGCEAAGYVANVVGGGGSDIKVPAEYHGLEGQSVAVLVDADQAILFGYPLAQLEVGQRVSDEIAGNVPGVKVVDAKQIVDFQQRNLYWNTKLASDLAKRLNVTRLVIIDLSDYRMHEPGNVNLWKGQISANVGVVEADSATPNDKAYSTLITVSYPPRGSKEILDSDERTIRLALLDLFAHQVTGKFYEHLESRDDRGRPNSN